MTHEEFKEEVRQLRAKLLHTARRYVDEDVAEDVVQDVLLRLWQMVDELRLPIEGLAMVLTRNRCIDKMRRRRPLTEPPVLADDGDDGDDGDDERIERMMSVIDTLPGLQQTILRLRHIEGMEMKDIAELIGSSEVALRKALSRARQAVRMKYLERNE